MKNRLRLALVTVAALASTATLASLTNIENAYETDIGHVRLPTNPRGTLTISECVECKPVRLRVDNQTLYLMAPSRVAVSLDALRAAVAAAGNSDRMVTVFYNLQTGFVTRVVLSAAG